MPSPLSADHPAVPPSGRRAVESLITQARRLKGDVDAVRRGTPRDAAGPHGRWQRALYDLALHQLDDLDGHLAQLREGPPPGAGCARPSGPLLSRVGSAEWNLLTDAADWSEELYRILGRDPGAPPLTLDELPSLVLDEDRPKLTAMVTGCLVDARPIDDEFRVVHPDGTVRTVHMMGEPVLDSDGSTASMWAVLRDVSELRRSQRAVAATREAIRARPRATGPEPTPLPRTAGLDLAAARFPGPAFPDRPGTVWYDACETARGEVLLGAGSRPGGPPETALLIGTLRGLAMAGTRPGAMLGRLALADTVCCTYRAGTRALAWAHTGHPAPLLFRDGTGRRLGTRTRDTQARDAQARDAQALDTRAEETLRPGDLLLLHTGAPAATHRLLALAPHLAGARSAQEAVRIVTRECAGLGDDTCVLAARVLP
ncbi:PAS domain-containing protein [Streptomyces sp. NPDC005876]|uniref:PAS domain-containing protein n=1 Tax=Streptomyces sp. NPDC005876 TaxID=3157076 RepID=UPI0033CD3F98